MQVLSRGIVFIDLAIAQIATLGVIAADRMGFEPEGWVAQVAAVPKPLAMELMELDQAASIAVVMLKARQVEVVAAQVQMELTLLLQP